MYCLDGVDQTNMFWEGLISVGWNDEGSELGVTAVLASVLKDDPNELLMADAVGGSLDDCSRITSYFSFASERPSSHDTDVRLKLFRPQNETDECKTEVHFLVKNGCTYKYESY
jgi:hypothetical protein